ncbi:MAG: hypothetical protein ACR2KV_16575 [Solirubrobacteraceae bacterium]
MASTSESREMLERWKAEHPNLVPGGGPTPARPTSPPRPRAVPQRPPQDSLAEQQEMIERWKRDHPQLSAGHPAPVSVARPSTPERTYESDRAVLDIAATPLTVLSAFIIGCILGGIAMVIVTGIAFWSFSGG